MIIVNCFSRIDNQFIWIRCLVLLDLNIIIGSYKFCLQATTDHHGPSMEYDYHISGRLRVLRDNIYCNDDKITICDKIITEAPPPHILYFKHCL